MKFLAIKNWSKFQHYRDRRPPWIKLYVHLIDEADFMVLTDRAKWQLMALWMLAARMGHPLPNNKFLLAGKLGTRRFALDELLQHGWLRETDAITDASTDASGDDSTDASADARASRASARSRERELEGETTSPSSPAAHVDKFAADAHRVAYEQLRRAQKNVVGFDHILTDINRPINGGAMYSWEVIGQALMEYAANGEYFSARRMRGYCESIANPRPKRGAKKSRFDQAMENMGMTAEVPSGH